MTAEGEIQKHAVPYKGEGFLAIPYVAIVLGIGVEAEDESAVVWLMVPNNIPDDSALRQLYHVITGDKVPVTDRPVGSHQGFDHMGQSYVVHVFEEIVHGG